MTDLIIQKKNKLKSSFGIYLDKLDSLSIEKLMDVFQNMQLFFETSLSDFRSQVDEYEENLLLLQQEVEKYEKLTIPEKTKEMQAEQITLRVHNQQLQDKLSKANSQHYTKTNTNNKMSENKDTDDVYITIDKRENLYWQQTSSFIVPKNFVQIKCKELEEYSGLLKSKIDKIGDDLNDQKKSIENDIENQKRPRKHRTKHH